MILENIEHLGNTSSTKEKEAHLQTLAEDELLQRVLYLMHSRRVKFWLKVIPSYDPCSHGHHRIELAEALDMLTPISERKVTGSDAKKHLSDILSSVSERDAEIIKRVIRKDAKIGMGARSINKVIKNLIEITPYMGAVSYDLKKVMKLLATKRVISQIKMDGRYANVLIHQDGTVEMESRQGEPTYLCGSVAESFKDSLVKGIVLNDELTMGGGIDRYTSNGIISSIISIRKKEADGTDITKELIKFHKTKGMTIEEAEELVIYTAWDCITRDEYFDNKSDRPYFERLDITEDVIATIDNPSVRLVESVEVADFEEALYQFQTKIKDGEEGTLLKSLDGKWKHGKPVWQIKMKLDMTVELRIVRFNDGRVGTKNEGSVGSIVGRSECGLVNADPGGIGDEDRDMFNADRDSFTDAIMEVKCCGLSQNSAGEWSLLHPSYVRLRTGEKSVADTLTQMQENEAMIKGLAKVV